MMITIENRSDKYLFEKVSTRYYELQESEGNILNDIYEFLVGYYEKKAGQFWNKLFGREFNEERTITWWASMSLWELLDSLLEVDAEGDFHDSVMASTYYDELKRITSELDSTLDFLGRIKDSIADIFTLTEEEYKLFFE